MEETIEWLGFDMVFDLISFLAGITAGGLTGALAGILYGFERTANLQESLLKLSKELDSIDPTVPSANRLEDAESKARMSQLHAELDSINEEIRRMYRKTTH
jgi:gas vesicle protein